MRRLTDLGSFSLLACALFLIVACTDAQEVPSEEGDSEQDLPVVDGDEEVADEGGEAADQEEQCVSPLAFPPEVDFGNVLYGESVCNDITIGNAGSEPITFTKAEIFGDLANEIAILDKDCNHGSPVSGVYMPQATLAAGKSVTFGVRYTPVDVGADTIQLVVTTLNDPCDNSHTINLISRCKGECELKAAPVLADFGSLAADLEPTPMAVVIRNECMEMDDNVTLKIADMRQEDSPKFSLGNCVKGAAPVQLLGMLLAPGDETTCEVSFQGSMRANVFDAIFTITTAEQACQAERSTRIDAHAVVDAPMPSFMPANNVVSFCYSAVGTTPPDTRSLILKNNGTVAFTLLTTSMDPVDAPFYFTGAAPDNVTLQPEEEIIFGIAFEPQYESAFAATLLFFFDFQDAPYPVTLLGRSVEVCPDGFESVDCDCVPSKCYPAGRLICDTTDADHRARLSCNNTTGIYTVPATPCAEGQVCVDGPPPFGTAECRICEFDGQIECFGSQPKICRDYQFEDLPSCNDAIVCTYDLCDNTQPTGCSHIPTHSLCDDTNDCTTDTCDPSSNRPDRCLHEAKANDTDCDDRLYCTVNTTCQNGRCQGETRDCSADPDYASCKTRVCNEALSQCRETENNLPDGTPCDDGSSDTIDDECTGGVCEGRPPVTCTTDGICCIDGLPANEGGACPDDGNVCTEDKCAAGECAHPNKQNGAACDDSVFCNGEDACNGSGVCVHAGDPCASGDACNNTCNEAEDNCFSPNMTACDDDLFCNGTDTCDGAGVCVHAGDPCAAGDVCNNTCNELADNCFSPSDTACNDANPCTTPDHCLDGVCVSEATETCSGHGDCSPIDGVCHCASGYAGQDCSECADGYENYPNCLPCNCSEGECCSDGCHFDGTAHLCRQVSGLCDVAEYCTGASADCPADVFKPIATTCRPAAGICDATEVCTGAVPECPADVLKDETVSCRAQNGSQCDLEDFCSGSSVDCPNDAKSTAVCREATNDCDLTEFCDGVGDDCPTEDLHKSDGEACGVGDQCAAGFCEDCFSADGCGDLPWGTRDTDCAERICGTDHVCAFLDGADGTACGTDDQCVGGACRDCLTAQGGCEDQSLEGRDAECVSLICRPDYLCEYTPASAGTACDMVDTGTSDQCDGSGACVDCVTLVGCSDLPDDENPCTDPACVSHICDNQNDNSNPCEDDHLCTTTACDTGSCEVASVTTGCFIEGICVGDGAKKGPTGDNSCRICDLANPTEWKALANGQACDDANAGTVNDQCTAGGVCQGQTCTPDCNGKECGDNGCGGSCGSCGDHQVCWATGRCAPNTGGDCGNMDGYEAESPWPTFGYCSTRIGRSPNFGPDFPNIQWLYSYHDSYDTYFLGTPIVQANGNILIGARHNGVLFSVFPTGQTNWRYGCCSNDDVGYTPSILADHSIVFGRHHGEVFSVTESGSLRWQYYSGDTIASSPAIDGQGNIYFADSSGILISLTSAGSERWTYNLGAPSLSSPALGRDGTVYITAWDHKLYAVDAQGDEKWTFLATDDIFSTPAIGADETIYFGSLNSKLYAIAPTGIKRWEYSTGGEIESSPAIGSEGTIFIGSQDGFLYAINPDGTLKWKFNAGSSVNSGISIDASGVIYFTSSTPKLWALWPDGTKKWSVSGPSCASNCEVSIGANGVLYVAGESKLYAINEGNITWVPIPSGTFSMGCSVGDADCDPDEEPLHTVNIPAFEILETEVTQAQYEAINGSNPSDHSNCPSCPVERVTWSQAKEFCEAVGGKLPSEAEWEYAARAGTTTKYYCGDDSSCIEGIAWWDNNSDGTTHPVGGKAANSFNLYDMNGNVWEWVEDCWHDDYDGAPTDGRVWQDAQCALTRVERGGSWSDIPGGNLRASDRGGLAADYSDYYGGFRCARDLPIVNDCTGQPAHTRCDDNNPCTDNDACNGSGSCSGIPNGWCWFDGETKLIWVNDPAYIVNEYSYYASETYCDNLGLGNIATWRLPTVDELRSLFVSCTELMTDGACGIRETCTANEAPCKTGCTGCGGPCHWPSGMLGNCDNRYYLSSTLGGSCAWRVCYNPGQIYYYGSPSLGDAWSLDSTRCVANCATECDGKQCGPDGCGGTCAPGCGANETCNPDGQCETTEPPEPPAEIILKDTTVIVPDESAADMTNSDPPCGELRFPFENGQPPFAVQAGDTVVSGYEGGFLCRVLTVGQDGMELVLNTEPGSLSDVIESGTLQFKVPLAIADPPGKRRTKDLTASLTIPNRTLYDNGGLSVTLRPGSLTFQPDLNVRADYGLFEGPYFLATVSGTMTADAGIDMELGATASIDGQVTIYQQSFPFYFQAGPLPVAGRVIVSVKPGFSASAGGTITSSYGARATRTVTAGAEYSDHQWRSVNVTSQSTVQRYGPNLDASIGLKAEVKVDVQSELLLYETASANVTVAPRVEGDLTPHANWSYDWDLNACVWGGIGAGIEIFHHALVSYDRTLFNRCWDLWNGSGCINQCAAANLYCSTPGTVEGCGEANDGDNCLDRIYRECSVYQTCQNGACVGECTSGACCDTAAQRFKAAGTACGTPQYQYLCTDGSDCGDDIYRQKNTQRCSGNSADCSGNWSGYLADGTIPCNTSQKCVLGQPTCAPCSINDCESGVCCNTSATPKTYKPSTEVCGPEESWEFTCLEGSACGGDVSVQWYDRHCPGNRGDCTGNLVPRGYWEPDPYAYCSSGQRCNADTGTCVTCSCPTNWCLANDHGGGSWCKDSDTRVNCGINGACYVETGTSDCGGSTPYCSGGSCVQCTSSSHCPSGYACTSNHCVSAPCGGLNQACCSGSTCNAGLTCSGSICVNRCGNGTCEGNEDPLTCSMDCAPEVGSAKLYYQNVVKTAIGCTSTCPPGTACWHNGVGGPPPNWVLASSCTPPGNNTDLYNYQGYNARWKLTIKKAGKYKVQMYYPPVESLCWVNGVNPANRYAGDLYFGITKSGSTGIVTDRLTLDSNGYNTIFNLESLSVGDHYLVLYDNAQSGNVCNTSGSMANKWVIADDVFLEYQGE
ncbi:MAG: choice-of-anchor D domain-containing protein [Myxococcales bacterium]|nr:MAG: choice-of-anchor D domain-containing protein [Myxococcales bacterium]